MFNLTNDYSLVVFSDYVDALVDRHDENQRLSGEQTYACETRQLQESSVSKPTASDLPASYSAVRNPFETGVDQRRLADQAPIPTLLQVRYINTLSSTSCFFRIALPR